jgi:GMP synthase (glutamine-hydrolysing)
MCPKQLGYFYIYLLKSPLMKPFLLLQSRPEETVSNNEYEAFLEHGGLLPDQLLRMRIESGDIPEINLSDYSGIMLGGSPYTFTDPDEKKSEAQKECEAGLSKLLDEILEKDFPFLGVCYGIGTVVSHEGGVVSRKYGEPVWPTNIRLTKEGQRDKLLKNIPESFGAIVGHKEACEVLPKSAILLASSVTCPVQLFKIKNNAYVTQFHVELDSLGVQVRTEAYRHMGYFDPEEGDLIIAEAQKYEFKEAKQILKNFVSLYRHP